MVLFANRVDAGRQLAGRLQHVRDRDVVVLGLPRGGVAVAFEVARDLGAPLDVIVVRKLGVPFQPELAMGAVGEGGVRVLNDEVIRDARVSPDQLADVERRERAELQRRSQVFRAGRPPVQLTGQTALVVDDGLATGSTAAAACQVARALGAERIVLAAPVAPPATVAALAAAADEVVCLHTPADFFAIGQFYDEFPQLSDEDVTALLAAADPSPAERDVDIPAGAVRLPGRLTVPDPASGVVVFAHGSGSSRHSPRNQYVAAVLTRGGLGTLLFDLLTPAEELDRGNVFDIDLLARRLTEVTGWLRAQSATSGLPIGYFGASTGAAAALWAAAEPGADIAAVVSRGGRPDLAGPRLAAVRAPTLLVVGGRDVEVLALNRAAQERLTCESRLAVVPGATHLFDEPGTLPEAAELAREWFTDHLAR